MTVKELIEKLQSMPLEAKVRQKMTTGYGEIDIEDVILKPSGSFKVAGIPFKRESDVVMIG